MPEAEIIAALRNTYQALRLVRDEKVRRRWAACEAMAIGWGGITAVAEATGLSRPIMRVGLADVQGGATQRQEDHPTEAQRIRRGGGGRRRLTAGAHANTGWVSVGIDHDTAQFAAASLRRWWQHMGSRVYPKAKELLVTADAGGRNGYRIRLWKTGLGRDSVWWPQP